MIKKQFLQHGMYYSGISRNTNVARWNERDKKFYYIRYKFCTAFVECIPHEDDESDYDKFAPMSLCFEDEFVPLDNIL
jgi:hypothetical protein